MKEREGREGERKEGRTRNSYKEQEKPNGTHGLKHQYYCHAKTEVTYRWIVTKFCLISDCGGKNSFT